MSVPEGVSIDDPVRMYLKEIGRVPLLVGEDEVKLAKRMDKGKQAYRLLHGTRHGVVAPVYTGKDSTQELIAKARELIKDEKTICDLRSITKALQFIEAREKSGNPCTIEEYKALVADFTRDECMRLHKLLQDEHITISGSEKVTPDAHTSDKEIHSLFDLKTILEEVKRRLPEEKDTAVFDAYLEIEDDYKKLLEEVYEQGEEANAACCSLTLFRKATLALLKQLKNSITIKALNSVPMQHGGYARLLQGQLLTRRVLSAFLCIWWKPLINLSAYRASFCRNWDVSRSRKKLPRKWILPLTACVKL